MHRNITKMFLLTTFVFLLIGLTAVNANDVEQTNLTSFDDNSTTAIQKQIPAQEPIIKSEYDKNINKNSKLNQKQQYTQKQSEEKIDTTLFIKFVIDETDEFSTENLLVTHIDEDYTIDITLIEDKNDTPLSANINLYQFDNLSPEIITLDSSGHAQKTYTMNQTGFLSIYAQFDGNENYYESTSEEIYIESEKYETKLTLNNIENTPINGTITIEGQLFYNDNIPLKNENVGIYLNNDILFSTITNDEGKYLENYVLENYEPQIYTKLEVKFTSDNEKFKDAYNYTEFDIEKIANQITINNIPNIKYPNIININGSVIDENNKQYTGRAKIEIIDTKSSKQVYSNDFIDVTDGIFNIKFIPENAGNYKVNFETYETDNYLQSFATKNINIEKTELQIQVEELYESVVNDNVSITGKITNEENVPVKNVEIEISTDSEILGYCVTDENGQFTFTDYTFTSVDDDDFFTIYFYVEEDDNHDLIFEETYYYLSKRIVDIELVSDNTFKINQTLHLEVNIKDAFNNSIIPDGSILIFLNNKEISTVNINQGKYVEDLFIGDEYINSDDIELQVLFIPTQYDVYYSDNYRTTKITHDLIETNIIILANDTLVLTDEYIEIRLLDEYENSLNETVLVKITNITGGVQYFENIQLMNGYTSINYKPLQEGIYNIQVQYDGKIGVYANNSKDYEFTASKICTNITLDNIPSIQYVNKTIVLTGKLSDDTQNPLSNMDIKIIINNGTENITLNGLTNQTGYYLFEYTPEVSENITIISIFDGTETYLEDYTNTSIEIIKSDTKVNINNIPTEIKYNATISIMGNVEDIISNSQVNGTISLYVNNEEVLIKELENSEFNINYKNINNKENNEIRIVFNENEVFKSSQNSSQYNTQPLETFINIKPINDTTINKPVTIVGTITNENNLSITGDLIVMVNELIIENVKAEEGIFTFDYIPTKNGIYIVNISYPGDTFIHQNSSNISTFNTDKVDLIIENITKTVINGYYIELTGQITNDNNLSVTDLKVNITINNKEYEVVVGENNTFKIITEKLIPDEYALIIHVNETDNFNKKEINAGNITINKNNPVIEIDDIINVTYSKNITINGTLKDSYGNYLNNTEVILELNNQNITVQTTDEGKFTVITNNFESGSNNLTVTIPETDYTNKFSKEYNFQANKQAAKIIFEDIGKLYPGDITSIGGRLVDIDNNPLINKDLTVTVNKKVYTVTTDDEGMFKTFSFKVNEGTYNISAEFVDKNYENTTATTQFDVNKLNVILIVENVKSVIGENITLIARLTDENNNPVSGGNLVFKINGRTLRVDDRFDTNISAVKKFSVNEGYVEFTMTADYYLRHAQNITASYSGSYKYESAKSNVGQVDILLRYPNVNVTSSKSLLNQHDTVTFIATITDVTDNVTTSLINQDANVIFKINGVTIKDDYNHTIEVPVINNTAKLDYNIGVMASDDINNNLRNYNLTAVYINPNYYPINSRNNTNFNVMKSNVDINIKSLTINNDSLSIKANLTDNLGYKLVGKNKLCVKINGITYKEDSHNVYFNITEGEIDLSAISTKGIDVKSVELVTGERFAYNGSRVTTTDIKIEN